MDHPRQRIQLRKRRGDGLWRELGRVLIPATRKNPHRKPRAETRAPAPRSAARDVSDKSTLPYAAGKFARAHIKGRLSSPIFSADFPRKSPAHPPSSPRARTVPSPDPRKSAAASPTGTTDESRAEQQPARTHHVQRPPEHLPQIEMRFLVSSSMNSSSKYPDKRWGTDRPASALRGNIPRRNAERRSEPPDSAAQSHADRSDSKSACRTATPGPAWPRTPTLNTPQCTNTTRRFCSRPFEHRTRRDSSCIE